MEYSTYWSILDTPSYTIKSNFVALIITLIGGLCWVLIKKFKKDKSNSDEHILLMGVVSFTILGLAMFILLTFIYPDNSDAEMERKLDSQAFKKVEGEVSNFQRRFRNTRSGAETIESFVVDSVQFVYGDALMGKFNSFTKTNNRVIYNGQAVKVTYREDSSYGDSFNSILKIEIGK